MTEDKITAHIFLNPENSLKVHSIRHKTGRSAGDIVNSFLEMLSEVEIEEIIRIIPKKNGGTAIQKKRTYRIRL